VALDAEAVELPVGVTELRAELERPETRFPTLSALHGQIQDAFNEPTCRS
jgi:hypothetical protein